MQCSQDSGTSHVSQYSRYRDIVQTPRGKVGKMPALSRSKHVTVCKVATLCMVITWNSRQDAGIVQVKTWNSRQDAGIIQVNTWNSIGKMPAFFRSARGTVGKMPALFRSTRGTVCKIATSFMSPTHKK